jgi:predicted RNase H-like HicB family nuclease
MPMRCENKGQAEPFRLILGKPFSIHCPAASSRQRHLSPTAGGGRNFFAKKPAACTIGLICHHPAVKQTLTAILTREDGGFVALCPEVDVASQGSTVEEAKANLQEAVELFFECASEEEVRQRMASEFYISAMEVQVA